MPIKVKKLAKELGIDSDNLIEELRKLYLDVEDESSSVEDKIAALVRIKLGKTVKKEPKKVKKQKAKRADFSGDQMPRSIQDYYKKMNK